MPKIRFETILNALKGSGLRAPQASPLIPIFLPTIRELEKIDIGEYIMAFENSSFRRGPPMRRPMGPKPVEEGHVYDITIESVGAKGDGIGKINGFVVIVPKGQQGQTVKVKINAVRPKFAFGEIVGEGEAPAESSEETSEETAEETPDETDDAEEEMNDDDSEDELLDEENEEEK